MKKEIDSNMITKNKENVFFRLKRFLINLFNKKENSENNLNINTSAEIKKENNSFKDSIMQIDNDETKLLKLQRKYRNGEIKEEDLTKDQVILLCNLYDKQISDLRKSNEYRLQKISQYKKIPINN